MIANALFGTFLSA